MGLFSGDIKTAAAEAKPLFDDAETRLRQIAYESLERFNGATVELSIVDNKLRLEVKLPPVSPPAA